MGIIVPGYLVQPYGLSLDAAYISTADTMITVARAPDADGFLLSCSFSVHTSKEARQKKQAIIARERIEIFSSEPWEDNVYTCLYSALKERYPNAIDDIPPPPV